MQHATPYGIRPQPARRQKPLPRHTDGQRFLMGPVPMFCLEPAMALQGKALAVYLEAWHEAMMRGSAVVKLKTGRLVKAGVERHAVYRGLKRLVAAQLIEIVEQRPGRQSTIEILWPPRQPHEQ